MTVAVAHSATRGGVAALRAAADEAVLRGEDLAVLHIISAADKVSSNDPVIEAQVAAQLADWTELAWSLYTAPEGYDTAKALLDQTRVVAATVLVIGSRKRTRVGKLILGSTVQRVILQAHLPVLVVKATS